MEEAIDRVLWESVISGYVAVPCTHVVLHGDQVCHTRVAGFQLVVGAEKMFTLALSDRAILGRVSH